MNPKKGIEINITPNGIRISFRNYKYFLPYEKSAWFKNADYFFSYEKYPSFKDKSTTDICNVELLHGHHLHWPILDIDIDLNEEPIYVADKAPE